MDKPKAQSLAVSYDAKRRSKKKMMAKGGPVDTAANERRPVPSQVAADAPSVRHNSMQKAPVDDKWTDQPTVRQAGKLSITPLSRPKMVNSAYKVRDRADVDKEEMLLSSMPPDGYGKQPASELDEEGARRQGPAIPSLKMKMMAEGGMINDDVSMHAAEEDDVQHPAGLESDDDQMAPSEDEVMADHFAEGGMAMEMDDQPEPEAEDEHHSSIASAIMAKRMMAEGGRVDIDENGEEQPNGYYQQNEHAALKENYDSDMDDVSQPMDSNEMGDEREHATSDPRDRVSAIRSRMQRMRR